MRRFSPAAGKLAVGGESDSYCDTYADRLKNERRLCRVGDRTGLGERSAE
jgi:hypothetical protein